jgi:hypothetical protein
MSNYSNKIAELLLDIFGGNSYFAQSRKYKDGINYEPIESPLTEELLIEHLNGQRVLGSYQLDRGSDVVKWFGWDVDSNDMLKARTIVRTIVKHLVGVPHVIEFSGGKGYHILVFLKDPMIAKDAKKIVDTIRTKEGLRPAGGTHVECFPKQDMLTKVKPKGSLLKIPLGVHPKTNKRSIFVDPDDGWEESDNPPDPELLLSQKATFDHIKILVGGGDTNFREELITIMSAYWTDGNRHDLSLFLSGFLCQEGWTISDTKNIILDIMGRSGDSEDYNRIQTIEDTYQRYSDGKYVKGRIGLGEILSSVAMTRLTEIVSLIRTPDTVRQIDDIRYDKFKSPLENIRLASALIWNILNDNGGKIFQTSSSIGYWYDGETHLLTQESTEPWVAMLNKRFGFNPNDAFSRSAMAEIRLRLVREAPIVPVYKRTFYSESEYKLFINLGGPEVYILDGNGEITTAYNGECGIMFVTNSLGIYVIPNLSEENPVCCWDYLTNDLSFSMSSDAPAKPEEQKELLKAWILGYFFMEIMPTKPILSLLGAPGSGKTTAMRRIIRILEDMDSDVLNVQQDKVDGFRASITDHRIIVMDNLEKSGSYWMVDMLNKLATGANIEIRELYKTNVKHLISPKCFIAVTAVNMPFSDETLFSRLLVLEMQKLEKPIPENTLQKLIREKSVDIWGDLLKILDRVLHELKLNDKLISPNASRLADFTSFCEKIKSCQDVNGKLLSLGLSSLLDMQLRALKESSQAFQLLDDWISIKPDEASNWHSFSDLYVILSSLASVRKMEFRWGTPTALARHLLALEPRLVKDYNAEIEIKDPNETGAKYQIRFKSLITHMEDYDNNNNGGGEFSLERI